MKISRISREPRELEAATDRATTRRSDFVRTVIAVTLALTLIGTGAVALPSLSLMEAGVDAGTEIPPQKGPQLEPADLSAIESMHETAGNLAGSLKTTVTEIVRALPSTAATVARATTAIAKPIADGVDVLPEAGRMMRATAHEAIMMKRGIIPLMPSKFARAPEGVTIPVSLTQYCVKGETRRGRLTRHGIVAADPRIFPLARYVEVFLGDQYLGRYGGNVLGATLDIWNPNCREAARFGRHWGSASLVAREVEQVPNDSLTPQRFDGLAKR
jgi:3D (Asp-Asp-Asp) domain-containing protein